MLLLIHYKSAKKTNLCEHIHESIEGAAECAELGGGAGVIACCGPGGISKRIVVQAEGDNTIDLQFG